MRRPMVPFLLLVILSAPAAICPAQAPPPPAHTDNGRMDWWRDARFGLFIHWGLYSTLAGEWKGSTGHAEWIRTTARIPVGEYDTLVPRFNPVKFDPDAWVKAAKDAGMRYVVITTKHHDGFCLFDSALTDFDVMSTPFHRDIMRELSEACARQGLRVCWYHSIMDWHHPDYLPRRDWEQGARPADGADFNRYRVYLKGQVTELLTKYGPIGVLWFDGEWESTWSGEDGRELYNLCRHLQPGVIVNNRVGKGRAGMAGMTEGDHPGDFGTPEQEVPAEGFPGVDWESCITMNDHWGYNRADHNYKSSRELIRQLVDIASKGGNYLLNIGPTPEGEFPPEALDRLAAVGRWMRVNGESIHGTRAGPISALEWGRCTLRQSPEGVTLYVHIFDWPTDGRLAIDGLGSSVADARLLADPGRAVRVDRQEAATVFAAGPAAPDPDCSVLAVRIRGPLVVHHPPRIDAPAPLFVRPMQITLTADPGVELRYTLSEAQSRQALYVAPFTIEDTATISVRGYKDGTLVVGPVTRRFERVRPAPGLRGDRTPTPGLLRSRYTGSWTSLPDFTRLTAAAVETVADVSLPGGKSAPNTAYRFEGLVRIPADDVYVFELASDDGSRLLIDGAIVVDNDGLHASESKRGHTPLGEGWHAMVVEYFNGPGDSALQLRWAPIGQTPAPLAADSLVH
jgi:alpha-L-fucosidase